MKNINTTKYRIMRYCYVDITTFKGGQEQHLNLLNKSLTEIATNCEIFMVFKKSDTKSNFVIEDIDYKNRITYISIPNGILPNILGIPSLLETFKPSLVHNHSFYRDVGLFFAIICKLKGIPQILSWHCGMDKFGIREFGIKTGFAKYWTKFLWLLKILILRALHAEFTALCTDGAKNKFITGPCTVTGSFMDPDFDINKAIPELETLCAEDQNTLRDLMSLMGNKTPIVQVAVLGPNKNQLTTLDAFNKLINSHKSTFKKDSCLILIGAKHKTLYKEKIIKKISTFGDDVKSKIFIFPTIESRDGMKVLYDIMKRNTGIIVLPSLDEGIPRVLFESSGFGIPGIFSNLDGPKDLIFNKSNGLLLDNPLDSDELADKICQLVSDKNLYTKISENSYKEIFNYNLYSYVKKYLELYSKILGIPAI